MGNDHEGGAEPRLQVNQFELGLLAELLVERRHRLVEQQNLRALRQRARQRHALALAAGQLIGPARAEPLELDEREHLLDPGGDRLLRQPVLAQAECDVPGNGEVGKQRVALEHHVDGTPMRRDRRDVLSGEQHAAFVGDFEAGEDAQQGGLAAARRPQQREELAVMDVEAEPVHRGHIGKAFRDACETHQRLARAVRARREAASHLQCRPIRCAVPLMRTNREMFNRNFKPLFDQVVIRSSREAGAGTGEGWPRQGFPSRSDAVTPG